MTVAQARALRPGDEVTWNDPDQGICTRTAKILAIDIEDLGPGEQDAEDTIISIDFEDGSEVQCFASELA